MWYFWRLVAPCVYLLNKQNMNINLWWGKRIAHWLERQSLKINVIPLNAAFSLHRHPITTFSPSTHMPNHVLINYFTSRKNSIFLISLNNFHVGKLSLAMGPTDISKKMIWRSWPEKFGHFITSLFVPSFHKALPPQVTLTESPYLPIYPLFPPLDVWKFLSITP